MPQIDSQTTSVQPRSGYQFRKDLPDDLKLFQFHRVTGLAPGSGKGRWVADCPFCGKEGKLGLLADRTQFNCLVCGENGNNYTFFKNIVETGQEATTGRDYVKAFNSFELPGSAPRFTKIARRWGLFLHPLTGEWSLPGRNENGNVTNIYVWRKMKMEPKGGGTPIFKNVLMGSPGVTHAILGYLSKSEIAESGEVDIAEGWRDGVTWELMTGRPTFSVPGTSSWRENWNGLVQGNNVNILFDNDWATEAPNGKVRQLGGPAGVDKIGGCVLPHSSTVVKYLNWASDDDPDTSPDVTGVPAELGEGECPSPSKRWSKGADLRDLFLADDLATLRVVKAWPDIADRPDPEPDPERWVLDRLTTFPPSRAAALSNGEVKTGTDVSQGSLTPRPGIETFKQVEDAWRIAMRWRNSLSQVLQVIFSVACSTNRTGEQLFLDVIGHPGTGKTRLLDAILVSGNCYSIESISGILSGWGSGHGQDDCSLLSRANLHCWVTPEADSIVKAAGYAAEMGKVRRVFDGSITASFKTLSEDRSYDNLRLTWVRGGTPSMLTRDTAGLGDRFLKIRIPSPSLREGRKIMKHVSASAWGDVAEHSGDGEKKMNQRFVDAYETTAGYLDYLVKNFDDLVNGITCSPEYLSEIERLAYRVAYLRSRPDADDEVEAVVEQPSRLVAQLTRTARCLLMVRNERAMNDDAFAVMEKLANDSSKGVTSEIVDLIMAEPSVSITRKKLQIKSTRSKDVVNRYLQWLTQIGVVSLDTPNTRSVNNNNALYGLTDLGSWFMGLTDIEEDE